MVVTYMVVRFRNFWVVFNGFRPGFASINAEQYFEQKVTACDEIAQRLPASV